MKLQPKDNLPSLVTLSVWLAITACSFLGRQIFNLLLESFTRKQIQWAILTVMALVAYCLLKKNGLKSCLTMAVVTFVAYFFFEAEELVHILLFGALGMSFRWDSSRQEKQWMFFALGAFLCVGDELLQAALPTRVGDIRDVALNLTSYLVGYFSAGDNVQRNAHL